jgi:hypothetical protein
MRLAKVATDRAENKLTPRQAAMESESKLGLFEK